MAFHRWVKESSFEVGPGPPTGDSPHRFDSPPTFDKSDDEHPRAQAPAFGVAMPAVRIPEDAHGQVREIVSTPPRSTQGERHKPRAGSVVSSVGHESSSSSAASAVQQLREDELRAKIKVKQAEANSEGAQRSAKEALSQSFEAEERKQRKLAESFRLEAELRRLQAQHVADDDDASLSSGRSRGSRR